MRKTLYLHFFCICFFFTLPLHAQWTKTNGLPGGRVDYFLNYGDTVLAKVGEIIYFSSNEGVSWSPVQIPFQGELSIDATDGKSILVSRFPYSSQLQNIFRTDDFFQTLHPVTYLDTISIVQFFLTEGYIYISDYHNLYRSNNDGDSWEKIPGTYSNKILVDGQRLTTTSPPHVIQSTDGGFTWDTLLQYQGNVKLALQDKNQLFVFTQAATSICYFSADDGQNWQQYSGTWFDQPFGGFEVHQGSVYGFDAETLIKTADYGQTWTEVQFPQSYYSPAYCGISTGNTLLIGGLLNLESASLYRSTDDAISWQPAANGIEASAGNIRSIGNDLYAVGNGGLFQLADDGLNWTEINLNYFPLNYPAVTLFDFIKTGNNWLLSDWGKPWVSEDGGSTWQKSNPSESSTSIETFIPVADKVIGKGSSFAPGSYIYRISEDYGLSFSTINSLMQQFQVQIISLDVDQGKAFAFASDKKIYRSDDGCVSWVLHATPSLADSLGPVLFSGLEMLVRDDVFFIFNSYLPEKMLFSKDAGQNWQYFNLDVAGFPWGTRPINDLHYIGNSLVATSEKGFFISKNDGADWTSWNEGFPYRNVYDLEIHDGFLWAATYGAGIWKRPLAEVGVKNPLRLEPDFRLTIIPNPASHQVRVETNGQTGELILQDATGKVVMHLSIESPNVVFSVEGLPQGLYQVIFVGEKTTQQGSLVVQR